MANVRDSDTSLWLHNKLGTSNDSWISGSICSQLNKEVLRNIKECFPDLQTQVKLKLLLSFFHIPRRLVEEWKSELEEVIEVAGLDSELWVSMLAETMKTFPATSSLNTEISDYEETRPIFTDMVNDLRKMVSKHSDLGMLPLECQYLNKNALVSVVGQQQNPVKHFTLKRKPKSANLRTELLHKSADAQSSLKKASAPTIPLRSRGMPRKMTDTTPLKGIPSRVPTSGFRSPNVQPNQSRPNMSRTPAGRKDGGIKLIEFTEQPLGYAAAKKRKRQQELEEQQKKALEQKQATATTANASTSNAASVTVASSSTTASTTPTLVTEAANSDTTTVVTSSMATASSAVVTPDYAPTLTYTQPPTPAVETMCDDKLITAKQIANAASSPATSLPSSVQVNNNKIFIKEEIQIKTEDAIMSRPIKIEPEIQMQQITMQQPITQTIVSTASSLASTTQLNQPIKIEKLDIKPIIKTTPTTTVVQRPNALANLPNNISVKITSTKATKPIQQQQQQQQQQQPILINSSTPVILSPTIQNKQPNLSNASQQTQTQTLKSLPLSQLKSATNSGPVIISQTIIQPAKRSSQNIIVSSAPAITSNISSMVQTSAGNINNNTMQQQQQQQPQATQYIITSSPQTTMPSLASFAQARPTQQTIYQTSSANTMSGSTQTPTKILLKTASSLPVMMSTTRQNQTNVQSNPPPLISTQQPTILNIQNVNLPNRPVTIQPASHAAQQQHMLQQQHHHQQQHIQQHQQIQTHTVVSNTNATQQPKLTQVVMQSPNNSNVKGKTIILTQKGVILRNIGGDMYQQIPISNMSGLQNLNAATIMTSGPPGLVKTTQNAQTIHVQQPIKQNTQQLPALIPTNNLNQNIGQVVVQQQPQHQQTVQTIIGSPPQQTIIRPVMTQSTLPTLPQGLTLIQRHGQQTQLVQMQPTQQQIQPQQHQQQQQQHQQQQQPQQQQQQIHRTILTQQPQTTVTNQLRPQQIILHHKPQQRIITTTTTQQALAQNNANNSNNNNRGTQIIEVRQQSHQQQQQQQQQQNPMRKGLSLSNEHVHKAHEMFRKANRVSRPDKALILGFMAGLRENPRPSSENVIVIKLGESEEKVQQEDGTSPLCLVESLIRLDYNTGEWKTFQNYRRLDQNSSAQNTDGGMQSQNSVVI